MGLLVLVLNGQEQDLGIDGLDDLELLHPALVHFLALEDQLVAQVGLLALALQATYVAQAGVGVLVGCLRF